MNDVTEILVAQQEQAVSLYKHEDTLIWQKLQHAVYVNGALAAIVGVEAAQGLKWIVSCAGAVFSMLFLIALENGYRYMAARLEAVQKVEVKLSTHGGIQPLIGEIQKPRWLPSTIMSMRVFLFLAVVAWAGLAVHWWGTG